MTRLLPAPALVALSLGLAAPLSAQEERTPTDAEAQPEAEVQPEVDFDALVDEAIDRSTGEVGAVEDLNRLWAATYQLPRWHFVVLPDDPTRPYVADMDGKSWLLAFTDADRLTQFVNAQEGLKRADDQVLFLSMDSLAARDWLTKLGKQGVFGVRFNQGDYGWFSPVRNLVPIHAHLVKLGLIAPPELDAEAVNLVLLDWGARKIAVIKEVRAITGLGLKDTKELIERAPVTIKEGLSRADAEAAKQAIEAAGGAVELR
jgi:ribosomal protein L7/L12